MTPLLWLAACLVAAAPAPEPPPPAPLRAAEGPDRPPPLTPHYVLEAHLRGVCAGSVLAEVRATGATSATISTRASAGVLHVVYPAVNDQVLRYGCDDDNDGVVDGEDVVSLSLGRARPLPPMRLALPPRDVAAALLAPREAGVTPRSSGPPSSH